jgi:hypothetical protein
VAKLAELELIGPPGARLFTHSMVVPGCPATGWVVVRRRLDDPC